MSEPSGMPSHRGSIRDAVRFNPERAVVATVVAHGSTRVFAVCMEAGQELPSHSAPGDLTLQVLEGNPVIGVGDSMLTAAQGDVVIVPPGTVHELQAGTGRAVVIGTLTKQA